MLERLQGVFASLSSHDVEYIVIGGIAAVLHGVPRATFDLDILIRPDRENVERLLRALVAAGLDPGASPCHELRIQGMEFLAKIGAL